MFQLALIAKENIDIDNSLNPLEILKTENLQPEREPQNHSSSAKTKRLVRNAEERNKLNDSEDARIEIETETF